MATITSAGSGLASATSTWVGGVVPVEGDKVIIAAGHVVTIDGTFTWGDDNVTATIGTAAVSVSGTLKASRSVTSNLTVKGLIFVDFATHGIDYGTEADPIPDGVTATLQLNKATTPAIRTGLQQRIPTIGAGNFTRWTFVGAAGRVRGVDLASDATTGSATITLSSASHGWKVGDQVGLMNTTNNSSVDECELRTVSSIDGGNPALVTLNAAPTYLHKAGSPVMNLSANVILKSFNEVSGQTAQLSTQFAGSLSTAATNGYWYIFKDAALLSLGGSSVNAGMFNSSLASPLAGVYTNYGITLTNCAVRNDVSTASFMNVGTQKPTTLDGCALYTKGQLHYGFGRVVVNNSWMALSTFNDASNSAYLTHSNNWATFRSGGHAFPGLATIRNWRISGRATLLGGAFFYDCDVGKTYGWKATSGDKWFRFTGGTYADVLTRIVRCKVNYAVSIPDTSANLAPQGDSLRVDYVDKDLDTTQQETYYSAGNVKRNNSVDYRSTSSVAIAHHTTEKAVVKEQSIPCANGQAIRVVGYVRFDTAFYNSNDYNAPTVTLSGLGATPVVFTASSAANGAWEKYDISITNSAGYDGSFTLTYSASAKTVTTGTVYFDGVPDAPFVTKARHYGFLFNETSPTVTVDPYVVLSEAAASALTGCTINGGTKRITFGAGTIDTASELYDYSRYWSATNLTQEVPLSRAGSLYSLASGWTVVDPSISGITWGGGTIDWTAAGTKSGSFDGNVFDFQAAGTYEFGGSTLSGTIEFVNTSGGAVIVNVPAGTSYTNTGPNITVNVAVDKAEALISGIVAGSRLQIYNVTTATEMVNAINATTSYTLEYQTGTGYTAGDVVRVRLTYCNGLTAKLPVEYTTIANAAGWSVLANQQDDDVYIANGIDGSTVTEYASDYINVQVDISDPDNQTTVQRGYAWYCDQITGDDGIRYFFGACQAEDAFNYLLNTDVADIKIKNTGTTGVTLTGGAVRRKDGSSPIAPGGSVYVYYGRAYSDVVTVSGSNVITGDIADVAPAVWGHGTRTLTSSVGGSGPTTSDIAAAVLSALQATMIPVDTRKMNGYTIIGDGSEANPWRGVGVQP